MRQNTNAQAQLPRELEGPTIATMGFQRTYYTVPWAMWADAGRLLWLHPDYTVKDHPGGTLQMRIELRDDGYHVWPPRGASYNPQQDHSYFGGTSQPFIPVAVLHAWNDLAARASGEVMSHPHSAISVSGWACDICGLPVNGQTDADGAPLIAGDSVRHI